MSDEYISREAVINLIKELYAEAESPEAAEALFETHERIAEQPAADVKPVVRGEWIKCGRDGRPLCSKCGYEPLEITREYIVDGKPHSWDGAYNLSNFCPNCGADMRKEAHWDV